MNDDCLKLTVYFGERARLERGFLADALIDINARHEIATSVLVRGVEGFGARQGLRTDRLLTLSEDLPLVSVAVDVRPRIEAALAEVEALRFSGLVTLERARLFTRHNERAQLPADLRGQVKLTVYVGRQHRVGGAPAHEAIVALLHDRRVAGATVLLGVDGTADGVRRRARFLAGNAEVPMMVIAVGDGAAIAGLLPELEAMLARPLITLERAQVCKRDGVKLAEPPRPPASDAAGRGRWQKLTVFAGEQSRHQGRPLAHELVRALRAAGAAGATSLRGVWGYHGDHQPHGDSFWALRRRVPVVTVVVDTPERSRDWFAVIDRLTDEAGLVTSELVPAFRATAPGHAAGGLALAARLSG